ncbi:hypothetical protein Ahia01_001154700 [Argonauta hians]
MCVHDPADVCVLGHVDAVSGRNGGSHCRRELESPPENCPQHSATLWYGAETAPDRAHVDHMVPLHVDQQHRHHLHDVTNS